MSWKKNAFSYLIWFAYTAITGLVLLTQVTKACGMVGLGTYAGIAVTLGYVILAGGIAFLLHRFAVGHAAFFQEKRVHFLVLGALLAVALFVVGFLLRLQGMDSAEADSSVYYEMAKVAEGGGVPESVHGAVYFYVGLLRGVFLLLGNNAVMGIWVQLLLQFGAAFLLFLAVWKIAGMMAGLVVLGFCMCAPYMVQSSLMLSPRMLFLFLAMAVLWYITIGFGGGKETQDACRPGLVTCFLTGILVALCCYLDILGVVLLIAALGGIFRFRGQAMDAGRKVGALLLCLAGLLQGFGACILLDAWLSGKLIHRVAWAWLSLYRPEGFVTFSQTDDFAVEICLLSAVMTFGIFSFWFDRERERISIPLLCACAIMAAGCLGIFTEEMPAYFFLYLAFAVLAGIGFGQCLYVEPAGQEETALETSGEQSDLEILMEGKKEPEAAQKGPRFLENPLPLPKKHVKRVLDYTLPAPCQDDDYDYPVSDDDDFDI